jgi:O-succinylbenzoic acid--CoA ligase
LATIIYQNQIFDKKKIQDLNLTSINDIYLRESLIFCQKWLKGEQTFEVKTSGSTGTPKIIYPTRQAIRASVAMSQKFFAWKGGEKALVCLHTQYIAGKMMLVRGLELGWTMYLQMPNHNPLATFEQNLDFAAFVPLQMQNILENTPQKLANFSPNANIIIGGASVSNHLEKMLAGIENPKIFQTYGMTETLSHIAIRRLNGSSQKNFFPLEQVQIRLNEQNCLCISSPTTLFQEIVTNDIAEIYADGSFRILGRADNIINSGGVKIQLEQVEQEIEKIFEQIGLQRRFYCIGTPDSYWGEMLTLCIEGEKLSENTENKLQKSFQNLSNKYFIPKKIVYLNRFSETETGKVKRIATWQ